ncbi:serine hydrolase [Neolewinella lacunae]|uniref:Serine hydrolase n=1 Tax=Neolewinella lacunae TaxID=1517758 RepID=A0A923TC95_9BACT|nr:serine hydrolase [Neolewinella lacunae]MBC6993477.1 serine hydrolase [Neolewinella lacunae]MDN3636247.1 serine hydrolase [Neolewinella lacunae]
MGILLASLVFSACGDAPDGSVAEQNPAVEQGKAAEPRYSLGQWSFHREHFSGDMNTFDFIAAADEMGFAGVEYVSQFFQDQVENTAFLDSLRQASEAAGLENVMILVDGAGNLGSSDPAERSRSIAVHLQWARAAQRIGSPAIRVNAHGDGTPAEIKAACLESIAQLAREARELGIRIVIENHGGISNNGAWLADLVEQLKDYEVGSLADFDNWCIARENGELWGAPCVEEYNRYQGMLELIPYAASVSVKAFNFDAAGEEPSMDYAVLFDILHARDYNGWLGIEYEGDKLPSREGIENTLALAKKHWPRQPVITPAAVARLDSTLEAFVAPGGVAGISALIYEKGEEVYFKAAGDADRAGKVPMARNTIAQIYSMTKPLTATALMQLYEAGKFSLDDPVAQYIPELANVRVYAGVDAAGKVKTEAPKRPMTIRDLTRHTAGFYNGGDHPALKPIWEAADTRNYTHTLTGLAEKLASIPLLFHPGEQWEYGPAVDVQALLVERIAGVPFDEYLRTKVLDPLGMQETRYFVPEEDRARMSSAYQRAADGTLVQMPDAEAHAFNINAQVFTPGGFGLTSTLDDYMTFARMLVNGGSLNGKQILKPETVQLMATNHLADSVTQRIWLPSKGQVGFGIDFAVRMRPPVDAQENPGSVGEFFWDGAASTLFWVDPANDLTAVLFVQLFPYDQIGLHRGFRAAVYGANE